MKNLFLNAIFSMLTVFSVSAAEMAESPVSMTWELVKNSGKQYDCRFVLENVSKTALDDDWTIYFNQFSQEIRVDESCPVIFSEVETGYYKMVPKAGFRLAAGEAVELDYAVKGSMIKIAFAPDGGHFAFRADSVARPLPIEKKPLRYGTFPLIPAYPDGERMYALNQTINPDGQIAFDPYEILPGIKEKTLLQGNADLSGAVWVSADLRLGREESYLKAALADRLSAEADGALRVGLSLMSRAEAKNPVAESNGEYYELSVSGRTVSVRGVTDDAVLNGVKTFVKLLEHNRKNLRVPNAEICDWPDLPHRGMMLDIARNFSSAENLKKLIAKLAANKLNVYQFHFTDDEGWRLEIPGLPELTEVGARRGMTETEDEFLCQFYAGNGNPNDLTTTSNGYITREQFIDLLRYAEARGVKIVPEIESPGHARAAIVAMKARYNRLKDTDPKEAERYRLWDPEDTSVYASIQGYDDNVLNVAEEGVYRFMEKVVDELILMYEEADVELSFIHVGGDEVAKDPWDGSPAMRRFKEKHGLQTTHDAEEYFITRIAEMIGKKGYRIGGWQEVAMRHSEETDKKLRPKLAGVSCWHTIPDWGGDSITYAIANNGYNVILCNVGNFYLDMSYNAHQQEPGLNWGGYVDEFRAWDARPFDIYRSSFETLNGEPLDTARIAEGKPVLDEESRKRIVGVQAQLFAETIRNFDMVEYYAFPKIFGLVERGWNAELLPGQTKARFNRLVGTDELPALKSSGFNFRLGMPGIRIEDRMLLMNSPYPEAEIRYTTDGSEPDGKSELWTSPVRTNAKVVKAKLFYLGKESKTTELHR